jgi:hypothetical protein
MRSPAAANAGRMPHGDDCLQWVGRAAAASRLNASFPPTLIVSPCRYGHRTPGLHTVTGASVRWERMQRREITAFKRFEDLIKRLGRFARFKTSAVERVEFQKQRRFSPSFLRRFLTGIR